MGLALSNRTWDPSGCCTISQGCTGESSATTTMEWSVCVAPYTSVPLSTVTCRSTTWSTSCTAGDASMMPLLSWRTRWTSATLRCAVKLSQCLLWRLQMAWNVTVWEQIERSVVTVVDDVAEVQCQDEIKKQTNSLWFGISPIENSVCFTLESQLVKNYINQRNRV